MVTYLEERFYQDIDMDFEHRYHSHYNENMMREYIWSIITESTYKHKRKSNRVHF